MSSKNLFTYDFFPLHVENILSLEKNVVRCIQGLKLVRKCILVICSDYGCQNSDLLLCFYGLKKNGCQNSV